MITPHCTARRAVRWECQWSTRRGSRTSSKRRVEALADSAFFCPFPTCQVAYFDMFERQVPVDALAHPVYPKDPQAPICPCFDFTTESIEADVREGGVSRTRALMEKAKSADARCRTMSASGQSCTGDVQRYFMKLRGGA